MLVTSLKTGSELGLMKKQSSGEFLAKEVQNYIEAHSKERFSLDEMADTLYVNGSYLLRTFKRYMNMTPLYYHHLVRCRKAQELLLQTDRSISEVGEMVGFVSSSHFSHVFHKTAGCTPSEYRLMHKKDDEETE